MSKILEWLIKPILDWIWGKLSAAIAAYQERRAAEKARQESNKQAEEKLQNAKTEEEVIDSGSDLLLR